MYHIVSLAIYLVSQSPVCLFIHSFIHCSITSHFNNLLLNPAAAFIFLYIFSNYPISFTHLCICSNTQSITWMPHLALTLKLTYFLPFHLDMLSRAPLSSWTKISKSPSSCSKSNNEKLLGQELGSRIRATVLGDVNMINTSFNVHPIVRAKKKNKKPCHFCTKTLNKMIVQLVTIHHFNVVSLKS